MRMLLAAIGALGVLACDKPSPAPTPEPLASAASSSVEPAAPASSVTVAAPSASVAEPPSAAASASPQASTKAAATPPTATTHASAVAVATSAPEPPAPTPAPTPTAKSASKRLSGKNFALDVASSGCRVAADCAMTIAMSVTGEFHVNKEYPYKFTATANPGATFLGKSDALTFTRAGGDFAEKGEKSATMTVRFKPARAGDLTVSGTYKLSVCSADQCQIEQQAIDLVVPVM